MVDDGPAVGIKFEVGIRHLKLNAPNSVALSLPPSEVRPIQSFRVKHFSPLQIQDVTTMVR
jgi:predicted phosphoribosyltransferase